MEQTDWDSYGTGNYEKCADCMAHCGYEATAVSDAIVHPLKALRTAFGRIRTAGPMAPEIPLDGHRPAAFVHDQLVGAEVAKLPERQRPRQHTHAAWPHLGDRVRAAHRRDHSVNGVKPSRWPARRTARRNEASASALCRARRSSANSSPGWRRSPPDVALIRMRPSGRAPREPLAERPDQPDLRPRAALETVSSLRLRPSRPLGFPYRQQGADRLKQRALVGCGGKDALAAHEAPALGSRPPQASRACNRSRQIGSTDHDVGPAPRTLSGSSRSPARAAGAGRLQSPKLTNAAAPAATRRSASISPARRCRR